LSSVSVLVGALLVSAGPGGTGERVVDMMVAQVDSSVITWSELVAEARLALLRRRGPEAARTAVLNDELLASVLRTMMSRELLLAEARRLQLRDPTDAEVDRALGELESRFEAAGDFKRFLMRIGFSVKNDKERAPAGLLAIVQAEIKVEAFLALVIRQNAAEIGKEAVARCVADHQGAIFESDAKEILMRQEQTARLRALIAQLEKKAAIRYDERFRQDSVLGPDTPDPDEIRCEPPKPAPALRSSP
jgi:hypothetical protein